MNFGRAFTYAAEDPDWLKKLGIAALVMLIPLVGAITVMGWGLEITRRVINNDPQPLPGWDNFGDFLMKGLKQFVVSLAYVFPIFLIYGCGMAVTFGGVALAGSSNDSSVGNAAGGIVSIVMICMYCFVILYAIAVGLLMPPAIGNLAATGELGAAFRFSEVFGLLRAAIGPYLLSLLLIALAAMILAPLGAVVCGIGLLVSSAYLTTLSSHLYGQAYNAAKAAQNLAPVAPPM
jgi:hypothetical protein